MIRQNVHIVNTSIALSVSWYESEADTEYTTFMYHVAMYTQRFWYPSSLLAAVTCVFASMGGTSDARTLSQREGVQVPRSSTLPQKLQQRFSSPVGTMVSELYPAISPAMTIPDDARAVVNAVRKQDKRGHITVWKMYVPGDKDFSVTYTLDKQPGGLWLYAQQKPGDKNIQALKATLQHGIAGPIHPTEFARSDVYQIHPLRNPNPGYTYIGLEYFVKDGYIMFANGYSTNTFEVFAYQSGLEGRNVLRKALHGELKLAGDVVSGTPGGTPPPTSTPTTTP